MKLLRIPRVTTLGIIATIVFGGLFGVGTANAQTSSSPSTDITTYHNQAGQVIGYAVRLHTGMGTIHLPDGRSVAPQQSMRPQRRRRSLRLVRQNAVITFVCM